MAATATTLVALLAVAAGAVPGPCAGGGLPIDRETIAPLREATAVRVVAAAMAAARDLLKPASSQAVATEPASAPAAPVVRIVVVTMPAAAPGSGVQRLGERLLDLPPPAC
jgi:hypothetical protein